MGDVDQTHRTFDIVFHQIDEIGAAGNELGSRFNAISRTASATSRART
jgi:uncharacterized protein YoxC